MKLTREQSQQFLREYGIWITEACDRCGKLLGPVRLTRKGELGEWCSPECRDGISVAVKTPAASAAVLFRSSVRRVRIGARKSGRPKTHATNAEKQRAYRWRLKSGLTLRNTPSQHIENSRLADANFGSHVVRLNPETQGLETAVSATSPFAERVEGYVNDQPR